MTTDTVFKGIDETANTFVGDSEETPTAEEEDVTPEPEEETPDESTKTEQPSTDELLKQLKDANNRAESGDKKVFKLESDVRAEQGRRRKSDTQLGQVQAQIDSSNKLLQAITKKLQDPDWDGLGDEVKTVAENHQTIMKEQGQQTYQESHDEAHASMMASGGLVGHKTAKDIADDPRYALAMDVFDDAVARKDPSGFAMAAKGAASVTKGILASQASTGTEKAEGAKEATSATKPPQNPGRGSGSGIGGQALANKAADPRQRLTPAENKQLKDWLNEPT